MNYAAAGLLNDARQALRPSALYTRSSPILMHPLALARPMPSSESRSALEARFARQAAVALRMLALDRGTVASSAVCRAVE